MDRDALKQKLEDARYKAQDAVSNWRAVDENRRQFIIRLGIMGGVLLVLLIVGAIFVWSPGGGGGDFQQARQVSEQGRTLESRVRSQVTSRPEFSEVTVTAVAITGDKDEYLIVYGAVPSQEAMDQLRETITSAAPNTRVDWRISVVDPAGIMEPEGG